MLVLAALAVLLLTAACGGQDSGTGRAAQPTGTVLPAAAGTAGPTVVGSPRVTHRNCVALQAALREVIYADNPAERAERQGIAYRDGRVRAQVQLWRRDGDFDTEWTALAQRYDLRIDARWRYGADVRVPVPRLCELADDPRVAHVDQIPAGTQIPTRTPSR